MPVTFNTDLRDLKDFGYVQQVPLDAMFKNLGYKQAQYDQSVQQVKHQLDTLGNIPSYGQDTQKKNEILNQVNQELAKFASRDMRDPNVQNELNSFIAQVGSSPDLTSIAARATKYNNDIKTFQELQKSGKNVPLWMQDSIVAAQEYYGKGEYNPDARFIGEVQVAPDINKIHADAIKMVKPYKRQVWNPTTQMYDTEEVYDPAKIKEAVRTSIQNDGRALEYYEKLFRHQNQGVDWNAQADKLYQQQKRAYQQTMLLSGNPDNVNAAQQSLDQLERARQSPQFVDLMKRYAYNTWMENDLTNQASAISYTSNLGSKINDAQLHARNAAVDYSYKQQENLDKLQLKTGLTPDATDDEGNSLYYTTDATGRRTFDRQKYYTDLANKSQQMDVELFQKKEDIKQADRVELQEYKNTVAQQPKGQQTKAGKTLIALQQGAATEDDEDIVKSMIGQNISKFTAAYKELTGNDVVGGFDASDVEEVKFNTTTGNFEINFDKSGSDLGDSDVFIVSQEEVANLLSDVPTTTTNNSLTPPAKTPTSQNQTKKDIGL